MELAEITDHKVIRHYITLLYTELFGQQSVPSNDTFNQLFLQLKDNKSDHKAYHLKADGEIIAFFTLAESFSIFGQGKYGIINELWVDKKRRSMGVGKRLIQEIMKIGAYRGWKRIDVSAPADEKWDKTFNFYRQNGFTFTGRKLKIDIK